MHKLIVAESLGRYIFSIVSSLRRNPHPKSIWTQNPWAWSVQRCPDPSLQRVGKAKISATDASEHLETTSPYSRRCERQGQQHDTTRENYECTRVYMQLHLHPLFSKNYGRRAQLFTPRQTTSDVHFFRRARLNRSLLQCT